MIAINIGTEELENSRRPLQMEWLERSSHVAKNRPSKL